MSDRTGTGDHDFCPSCDEDVTVVRTVPWQANLCGRCSRDLPANG